MVVQIQWTREQQAQHGSGCPNTNVGKESPITNVVVIADRAIGPSLGLELIGLPSFGLKVCVWEGGAHEVQSKGLEEASERACLTKAAGRGFVLP